MNLPALQLPGVAVNLAMECDKKNFQGLSKKKDGVDFFDTFLFQVLVPAACTIFFAGIGFMGWCYHRFIRRVSNNLSAKQARKKAEEHVTRCWELFFFMLLVDLRDIPVSMMERGPIQ